MIWTDGREMARQMAIWGMEAKLGIAKPGMANWGFLHHFWRPVLSMSNGAPKSGCHRGRRCGCSCCCSCCCTRGLKWLSPLVDGEWEKGLTEQDPARREMAKVGTAIRRTAKSETGKLDTA